MMVPCWRLVATPQCQNSGQICKYWDEGWRSRVLRLLRWRLTHPHEMVMVTWKRFKGFAGFARHAQCTSECLGVHDCNSSEGSGDYLSFTAVRPWPWRLSQSHLHNDGCHIVPLQQEQSIATVISSAPQHDHRHTPARHYGLALPKGLLFCRLRTAESSAATAFARCFSVCAAVTTSLQGNDISQTPTSAQSGGSERDAVSRFGLILNTTTRLLAFFLENA